MFWTGVFWGSSLVAAAALLVVLTVWRRRARAIDEVVRGLTALAEDRPLRPVQGAFRGASGRLARGFNEVGPGLEARLRLLEADRQLLRAVLESMAEGVLAIDARRRLLFANHTANHMFELRAEAVGKRIVEVIRSPQVQEAVSATLASSGSHQAEITLAAANGWTRGQSRILAVAGTPLPGSPPAGAVLVFHDVTETRRLERVRQDFVANASHELKTPLASIKAYTETLLEGALHDPNVNEKFLLRIEEQAARLELLILDLLSLARLESGQDTFRHEPLQLVPVVRQCVESLRARADAKDLAYRLVLEDGADGVVVKADDEAIRQILDNLVDNAIKYTPAGGRVEIRLRRSDAEMAVLEVSDTGIGIPREDLPRVFERFYRVDRARSRELGGTGLGLSIVKHLTQSIGGSVSVESRVGAGSVFAVKLPTTREAREEGRTGSI